MELLHKSFIDYEDRSASLVYDGTDAPTAETDRDGILGKSLSVTIICVL